MRTIFISLIVYLILTNHTMSFAQQNNTGEAKVGSASLPLYNIFYLSKYIGAYEGLNNKQRLEIRDQLIAQPKFDSLDNSSLEKMPRLREFLNDVKMDKSQILFKSLVTAPGPSEVLENHTPSGEALKKLKELDAVYKNINFDQKFIETNDPLFKELKEYTKTIHLTDTTIQIKNKTKALEEKIFKIIIPTLKDQKTGRDTLYAQIETLRKKLNTKKDSPSLKIDSILMELQQSIDKLPNVLQNYAEIYLESSRDYSEKYVDKFIISVPVLNYNFQEISSQSITNQIHLSNDVQAAQQGLSYSGINLPSQSQMIEAMAMFLAKRAKQEAAIWFMDELYPAY